MKKIKLIFTWLLMAATLLFGHWGQGQEAPANKYQKIQKILDKAVENGLSGVSVYISHPKHGEWSGTSGYASLEKKDPLLPEHIISLASVGKTYAATAAMLMHEDGLLKLDKLIKDYLPSGITDNIQYADEVTVRQLMNMTTGFYNYSKNPELNADYLAGKIKLDTLSHLKALERYMFNESPWQKPGVGYNYCSTNYVLLTMIMDRVLGYPHQEYYQKKIFEPLKLKQTTYRSEPEQGLADHYGDLKDDGSLTNLTAQMIETTNWFQGDDGVYSTAKEAGLFMKALCTEQVVSKDSWKQMSTWVDDDYGLGLMYDKGFPFKEIIGHSGAAMGSTADVYYLPKQDMVISIVSNTGKRIGNEKYKKAYYKMRFQIVKKMVLF